MGEFNLEQTIRETVKYLRENASPNMLEMKEVDQLLTDLRVHVAERIILQSLFDSETIRTQINQTKESLQARVLELEENKRNLQNQSDEKSVDLQNEQNRTDYQFEVPTGVLQSVYEKIEGKKRQERLKGLEKSTAEEIEEIESELAAINAEIIKLSQLLEKLDKPKELIIELLGISEMQHALDNPDEFFKQYNEASLDGREPFFRGERNYKYLFDLATEITAVGISGQKQETSRVKGGGPIASYGNGREKVVHPENLRDFLELILDQDVVKELLPYCEVCNELEDRKTVGSSEVFLSRLNQVMEVLQDDEKAKKLFETMKSLYDNMHKRIGIKHEIEENRYPIEHPSNIFVRFMNLFRVGKVDSREAELREEEEVVKTALIKKMEVLQEALNGKGDVADLQPFLQDGMEINLLGGSGYLLLGSVPGLKLVPGQKNEFGQLSQYVHGNGWNLEEVCTMLTSIYTKFKFKDVASMRDTLIKEAHLGEKQAKFQEEVAERKAPIEGLEAKKAEMYEALSPKAKKYADKDVDMRYIEEMYIDGKANPTQSYDRKRELRGYTRLPSGRSLEAKPLEAALILGILLDFPQVATAKDFKEYGFGDFYEDSIIREQTEKYEKSILARFEKLVGGKDRGEGMDR